MQVSVTSTEGLERRMTVELPADGVEQEVQQRLKSMAGRVRLDGFRPGKVPFKVVEKRYAAQVRQEVQADMVQNSFYEAVQKEKLRPAGAPKIELSAAGNDKLAFTATFEVYPEVKVSVPADMVVQKPVVEISAQDLDNMIEKLRKQRAGWEEVSRTAAEGDQVIIDFLGKLNGEPFSGGEAQGYPLVLGSKRFIPGFEEQLIGANSGESREVSVTFPEQYQNEELAGKAVVFEVTVQKVNGPKLPDLNDAEFLKTLGVPEGGIEALRKDVHDSMMRELEQKIANQVKNEVLDKLFAANPVELPSALVESEIQQMANQARQSMGMQGQQPMTDEVRTALQDQARRRVALGLLIGELIREKAFRADADKIRARIEALAVGYEEPSAVVAWYYEDRSRLAGVEALVLEDQVVDWILSEVKVEEVKTDFDEAMQAR